MALMWMLTTKMETHRYIWLSFIRLWEPLGWEGWVKLRKQVFNCKWFELSSHIISRWSMIVVIVVLRRTVCDNIDWRFNNLRVKHRQSFDNLTSAQVVETSVIAITNSPSQTCTQPDDHFSPSWTYEVFNCWSATAVFVLYPETLTDLKVVFRFRGP